ncbi:MAG: hypothetical protein ACLR3S_00905 [Clostridium fessum]
MLDRQNPSLKLAKPELQDEGMTAVFPYLEGKRGRNFWEKF